MTFAIDPCEPRRLFAFALPADGYGAGGNVTLSSHDPAGPQAIFALADGGTIVQSGFNEVRRYAANGQAVVTYAGDGSLDLANTGTPRLLAVDAATGRLAEFAPGRPGKSEIRFYSSKGKLERVILTDRVDAMAFDRAGRLLVALRGPSATPAAGSVESIGTRVARYDAKAGALDASFGVGGTASIVAPGYPLAIRADAENGVALVTRTPEGSTGVYGRQMAVARLDVDGRPLAGFADGSGLLVWDVGSHNENYDTDDVDTRVDDVHVAAAGSVLIAGYRTSSREYIESGTTVYFFAQPQIEVVDAAGARRTIDLTPAIGVGNAHLTLAGETASDDAPISLVARRGTETRLYTLDPKRFAIGTEGGELAAPITVADATIDARGRLLVLGVRTTFESADNYANRRGVLAAFNGRFADSPIASAAGAVTRLGDGTVDVNGTSKSDSVVVRQRRGKLEITVNGKRARVSIADATLLLIHTGKGDDNVRVYGEVTGRVRVLGGAGDDTLTGGGAADLIEGGDGDDYLEGRAGDDVLRGGNGNDTLRGSEGGDSLYGDGGEDVLYGSNDAGFDDRSINYLAGGAGADRFFRSLHSDAASDTLGDRRDDDVLVL